MKYAEQAEAHLKAGRSPPGECGLKFVNIPKEVQTYGSRSPPGECGLKYDPPVCKREQIKVAPLPGSVD